MTRAALGTDWSRAAASIRSGGVIAFPTDTVFGLGCSIYSNRAIEKILAIKGRGSDRGLPILIADLEPAASLVKVTPAFQALAEAFWPGALTIVASALPDGPDAILASDGTIGLRVPGSGSVRRLIEEAGCPIIGTSANRTGREPVSDARAALDEFRDEVDYVLDGTVTGATASSVVSVAREPARLLRLGAISGARIQEIIPGLLLPEINT